MTRRACSLDGEERRGLFLLFTGEGKGKTTAAVGCAFRALGHGCRVCMIQFIKGPVESGERLAAQAFGGRMEVFPMGKGFIMSEEQAERERGVHLRAWEFARKNLDSDHYDLVILDELTYLLNFGLLEGEEVLGAIGRRPAHLHVIVTGRNAPSSLIEAADVVTEMREIKHPHNKGVTAREGIDF